MTPRDDPPRRIRADHVETSPGGAGAGADATSSGEADAGADATSSGEADAGADPISPCEADAGTDLRSPCEVDAGADPTSCGASGASGAPAAETHELRIAVWDAPAAVERGQRFAIRVGLSCSSRCRPTGWTVEVRDQDGARRATTTLGDDPWPGTDALYHAAVALVAPDSDGLHTWEAATLADDGAAVAHAGCSSCFGVRVVSAPACVLTVVATDAETSTPVKGARVVAHPYRAVTDARGVATLRVPAGEYRLFVSGKGAVPFRFDGEVKTDTTIRAALVQDMELSDADIWS